MDENKEIIGTTENEENNAETVSEAVTEENTAEANGGKKKKSNFAKDFIEIFESVLAIACNIVSNLLSMSI